MELGTKLASARLFGRSCQSEIAMDPDDSVVPLGFSMSSQPPFTEAPPSPATEEEDVARTVARLDAKQSPCDSAARHISDSVPVLQGMAQLQPYSVTSLAEEGEATQASVQRRSFVAARDNGAPSRDSLQVLQDICYRKLSTPDLMGVPEPIEDPCAFRNLHFDEPPSVETVSAASVSSRRGSRAGTGTPDVTGSRRSSSCYSCHDASVIANRRRVSCYTEGTATPAIYKCNGTRCGGSHHCPEAFDDPCCGAAADDFWVQAYYNEERRKRNKRARAARKAKSANGARRASRVPASGSKRTSAVADLESSKEIVSAADKKRRWIVYIFATFVVMLVALAVLMVIVSLSMGNRAKVNATVEAEAVTTAASLAVEPGE